MRAIIVLIGLVTVIVAACSTAPDTMPGAFDGMPSDEVGCTVKYGDDDLVVVGPLGAIDSENVEPNDYTLIRVGRTASDLIVVAEGSDWASHGGTPLNQIAADGSEVARGPFLDSGNPGYVVICWRGDT